MQWFKNLNTIVKIMVGVTTLLAITGIVGYQGIQKMAMLDERLGISFDRDLVGVSEIKETAEFEMKCSRACRNAVLAIGNAAEVQAAKREVEVSLAGAHQSFDKAAGLFVTENGKAKIAIIRESFPEYERVANEIVRLAAEGKEAQAREALKEAGAIRKRIEEAMSEASRAKVEIAGKDNQESHQTFVEARSLMTYLILGAVVIGLVLGWYIADSVSRPLRRAVTMLQEVAAGDLTRTLDVDSKDEVGRMANALNQALESIRETLVEVSASAGSLTAASEELAGASENMASGAQEQAAKSRRDVSQPRRDHRDGPPECRQCPPSQPTGHGFARFGGERRCCSGLGSNRYGRNQRRIEQDCRYHQRH